MKIVGGLSAAARKGLALPFVRRRSDWAPTRRSGSHRAMVNHPTTGCFSNGRAGLFSKVVVFGHAI